MAILFALSAALPKRLRGHHDYQPGLAHGAGDGRHDGAEAAGMVGVISLCNGLGRVFWAWVSDYIGRAQVYFLLFLIQAAIFFLLPRIHDWSIFTSCLPSSDFATGEVLVPCRRSRRTSSVRNHGRNLWDHPARLGACGGSFADHDRADSPGPWQIRARGGRHYHRYGCGAGVPDFGALAAGKIATPGAGSCRAAVNSGFGGCPILARF